MYALPEGSRPSDPMKFIFNHFGGAKEISPSFDEKAVRKEIEANWKIVSELKRENEELWGRFQELDIGKPSVMQMRQ